MVLRLDPRYPVVWRDPTSLQIGAETPIATLSDVSVQYEQLIGALMAGVSRPELDRLAGRVGIPADEVPPFLELVSPALVPRRPTTAAGYVVEGSGPTAQRISFLLTDAGCTPLPPASTASPKLAILVANHVVEPRRYVKWLSRDIPHLAVVYTDTGARIGPLVEPGRGPCLNCLARHAVDRDPAWPAIASQLLGQGAASEREPLLSAVAGLAARVAGARLVDGNSELASASLSLDARSLTGRRDVHRQHPDCGCRSLTGNETVHAAATHGPAVRPTTGTVATAHG
jgi:bacteriocin biosynthesis cyclodehydratase domain-containing protein